MYNLNLWIKNIHFFLISGEALKNWSCTDHKESLTKQPRYFTGHDP